VADELPVIEEEPLEVATVALVELELEPYAFAALHQEMLVCSAPNLLGSKVLVLVTGSKFATPVRALDSPDGQLS